MARYRIEVAHEPSPLPLRDAEAIALRVYRDGEYLQFVNAAVSGIDLATVLHDVAAKPDFWVRVVECATERLPDLVESGAIPLDDAMDGYLLPIDPSALRQKLENEVSTRPDVGARVGDYDEVEF